MTKRQRLTCKFVQIIPILKIIPKVLLVVWKTGNVNLTKVEIVFDFSGKAEIVKM